MKPNKLSKEERKAMAEKMDADLDRFMDELAANRSSKTDEKKPFDFDEWCKTIDQHPAFMTNLDVKNSQYLETIEALQAMKYSNDEDGDDDLFDSAAQHKDEGNKHFKFKKYRWAVDCYTNGIKLCCEDQQLNSVLYANRAAAQKYLGNKRSALRDCVFARRFDPANSKAIKRGAECLLELGYAKQCMEWIDSSLSSVEQEVAQSLEEIRSKARQLIIKQERDTRQQKAQNLADSKKKQALLTAFEQRQITFKPTLCSDDTDDGLFDWSALEVRIGQFDEIPIVHFDEESRQLVWPLLLQYPEIGQTDFVTHCLESSPFKDALAEVLESSASWDSAHDYRQDNVRLFVALDVYDDEQLLEVNFDECLKHVLSVPDIVVTRGLPVIQIYTKGHISSKVEELPNSRLRFAKKNLQSV